MNIENIDMGSYKLHFIKTKKFKTITIDVDFYRKIKKEEITKRNLLKMVLLDSSKTYKTEKELIIESENLYDIKVSSKISRLGSLSNLSFQTKFLNDKYTEENMNRESIIFFLDLIFNPNIIDNKFINIDKQKEKLKQDILSIKDNKSKYAYLKLMEKYNTKEYSYNTFGYIEDLEEIDGSSLYEYYKNILNEDQIDIFVLGDFSSDEIKEIFKEYFKVITFKRENKELLISELPIKKRITRYHEYSKINATELVMLLSLNNLTDFERKYTIKVFAEALGGSSYSVLFDRVRENKGYCYYINASVKAYDNILVINSGTDTENTEKCIKLIRKCLKEIKEGKLEESIVKNAINTIISGIKASSDNPISIINTSFSSVLVGTPSSEERIKAFSSITTEDIIKVSKKVNLNSILSLEKGDNSEKD